MRTVIFIFIWALSWFSGALWLLIEHRNKILDDSILLSIFVIYMLGLQWVASEDLK